MVSFLGTAGTTAKFVGIFRVGKRTKCGNRHTLPKGASTELRRAIRGSKYRYECQRILGRKGLDDLIDKLVIDWGRATQAWHQRLPRQDKQIVEILPYPDDTRFGFQSYSQVCLDYQGLRKLMNNPTHHREWHKALRQVAGVYLILDRKTGQQYVGSAYGQKGILGRWRKYARTAHGGNAMLKKIIGSNRARANEFQFSILRTLDLDVAKNEVIKYEQVFKDKLGTHAFGLNLN